MPPYLRGQDRGTAIIWRKSNITFTFIYRLQISSFKDSRNCDQLRVKKLTKGTKWRLCIYVSLKHTQIKIGE